MSINNRRIFPNTYRRQQIERARQQVAEELQRISQISRNPTPETVGEIQRRSANISRTARGYRGIGFSDDLIRTIDGIERYSRTGASGVIGQILGALGTPGRLISSWLRGSEGQRALRPIRDEVQKAMNLMNSLAPLGDSGVTPEQAGAVEIQSDGMDRPNVGAGAPANSSGGGRSRLPPGAPPAAPPDDDNRPHRNVRILPNGNWHIRGPGYDRVLPATHPALSGQMMPATSSNVHSYGYRFDFDKPTQGSLIVRFLQADVNRSGPNRRKVPGPTYEYFKVHPDFFDEMWRAASKGVWIWDRMRIRGTIAGHQYAYSLIRAAQNYLPRRAFVHNGRQILQRRRRTAERRDGTQYQLVSPLRTQYVGEYRPSERRPNVGNMDRGAISRGAPDRGRLFR